MFKSFKDLIYITTLFFLIFYFSINILNYQNKNKFYSDYLKELKKETEKEKQLKNEIVKNKNFETIEKNIREKLNYHKENEITIIMPNITITPTPKTIQKSNIEQWFELLTQK